jgi:hypothetical protein
MQTTRLPQYGGPEPIEMQTFYAGVLAAARAKDPSAYLDYENFLTIPEVCWSGKRLLLTYVMREYAAKYGQNPADVFNGVVTPSVRAAVQRDTLTNLNNSLATCGPDDKAWLSATIAALTAFWQTPQGQGIVEAPPTPGTPAPPSPFVPLKPIIWPFG